MEVREFVAKYKEAFGDAAPLPIAFGYSNQPAAEIKRLPKCLVGAISKVRGGESLTLAEENVICGGGGLYTAFTTQFLLRLDIYRDLSLRNQSSS